MYPPDTLETVGVNEVFVAVTVDESFTTEQVVVGRIDEIHILITVRTAPIVGYVSPDSLEDFLTKTARVSVPWCASTSSLPSSICPSRPVNFFSGKICFLQEFATNTG